MIQYLVLTSINPPTEAVARYAHMRDWNVILVGDKKTPRDWHVDRVRYLSPGDQAKLPYASIKHVPWNRPARANIGYLAAMEQGADFITQADDDNVPNEYWGVPAFEGTFHTLAYTGFINIYTYFTDTFIWPRGLPLDKILARPQVGESVEIGRIGVWQHLADNDTDVDAIYRLTNNSHVRFRRRDPLALAPGTVSPFNCQSTTFHRDVYPLLYLPICLTSRASDIVRSLIAQPIMWHHGYSVGFTSATVTQHRNPHNYLHDFEDEILIYLHSEDIFRIAQSSISAGASISEQLVGAYRALFAERLVPGEEVSAVEAWVMDCETIAKHT